VQKRQGRLQPKATAEQKASAPSSPRFSDSSEDEDEFAGGPRRRRAVKIDPESPAESAGVGELLGRLGNLSVSSSAAPAAPDARPEVKIERQEFKQEPAAPRRAPSIVVKQEPAAPAPAPEQHDDQALSLDSGRYVLPGKIASTLYPHQIVGVRWLWSIYKLKRGGILVRMSSPWNPLQLPQAHPIAPPSHPQPRCLAPAPRRATTWAWARPCSAPPSWRAPSTAACCAPPWSWRPRRCWRTGRRSWPSAASRTRCALSP
jgi:hypothetical protein